MRPYTPHPLRADEIFSLTLFLLLKTLNSAPLLTVFSRTFNSKVSIMEVIGSIRKDFGLNTPIPTEVERMLGRALDQYVLFSVSIIVLGRLMPNIQLSGSIVSHRHTFCAGVRTKRRG